MREKAKQELSLEELLVRAENYLSYRPRSEFEVRTKLKNFSSREKEISEVIRKLKRLRFLDDEEFARSWIEQRRKGARAKGWRIIVSELRRKGISKEIIEKRVGDSKESASEDDFSLALSLAKKKLPSFSSIKDGAGFRRRLGGFLLRRGFDWEVVKKVLGALT